MLKNEIVEELQGIKKGEKGRRGKREGTGEEGKFRWRAEKGRRKGHGKREEGIEKNEEGRKRE